MTCSVIVVSEPATMRIGEMEQVMNFSAFRWSLKPSDQAQDLPPPSIDSIVTAFS